MRSLEHVIEQAGEYASDHNDDIDDLSPRHFVAYLCARAASHRAVRHPYLDALAAGSVANPAAAIADLAHQYLAYSLGFTRYLTATIAQLERAEHRQALIANLAEESGSITLEDMDRLERVGIRPAWIQGIPHALLFRRFLRALDMDDEWLAQHAYCDDAVIWSHLFLQCCSTGGAAQAVGAIGLGTEGVVRPIYEKLLIGIDRYLSVDDQDKVFFTLHALEDDAHGEILAQIAIDLAVNPAHRAGLYLGMMTALNLRASFFDTMHRRAQSHETR